VKSNYLEEAGMAERKKVIAISGSTRRLSTNLHLIKAIMGLYLHRLDIDVFQHLADLPHFNPDLDTDNPPPAVSSFRKHLNDADGILICTPEYAMGVPGTLKNAIDWTVSSMEFAHKPVALITASSSGEKGTSGIDGVVENSGSGDSRQFPTSDFICKNENKRRQDNGRGHIERGYPGHGLLNKEHRR
jgi:hypothetical protein